MNTRDDQMRRRLLLGFSLAAFVALLLIVPIVARVDAQPPTPPGGPPAGDCTSNVHYYRYDVSVDNNGPAAPTEVDAAKAELHTRRCSDPALVAQHASYQSGSFAGTQALLDVTNGYVNDRASWANAVGIMEAAEAKCSASVETMSGEYKTMYMKGTQPVPSSYPADPDRPSYQVLRFSCPDGSQWDYKLDCGFQPVGQFPPPPEGTPPPAPPTGGPTPTPPPVCTRNCGPTPTTTPPTTTPPTTTGCTVPQGCKPYVPPTPAQCADPAHPCQPGVGPPTPRPPDSTQPTVTVVPPSSVLPPPAPLPQPQPTVTAPITSPPTAPA